MSTSTPESRASMPDRSFGLALAPLTVAALSFATTIVFVLIVYLARFDVGGAVETVILAVIPCGVLLVAIVVHLVSIPTRRLPHAAKLRREERHRAVLTGVLGAALLLEAYAAAFDLNSWWEWTVFAGFAATAVGAAIAVQTPLR
jgi:hypothetical protein